MKIFLGFVKKEFFHIFRDRRTLIILFGMPVVQIILFGYAITNEVRKVRIAIVDPSRDPSTLQLTHRLMASGYFKSQINLFSNTRGQVDQAFRQGKIKMAILFESGFAQKLRRQGKASIQIQADASDPNMASTLINYATAILLEPDPSPGNGPAPPMEIHTRVQMLYNPDLKSVDQFIPGLMTLILMLVSAMMTSITIAREKELGTMEILLASPLRPGVILLGKVVPYLVLSFVNAAVILGMGVFVFGVPVVGSLVLLTLECTLFILCSLSLGIMISTLTSTQQAAMMISMAGLLMPTVMLSGYLFPIESMPALLRGIAQFIPARWFIVILKNVMLKGTGLAGVWKPSLILLAMTALFTGISIKKFKIRLS
ncbi:MAG: ABC transporter permease [Chitinophagaceae bacterium]